MAAGVALWQCGSLSARPPSVTGALPHHDCNLQTTPQAPEFGGDVGQSCWMLLCLLLWPRLCAAHGPTMGMPMRQPAWNRHTYIQLSCTAVCSTAVVPCGGEARACLRKLKITNTTESRSHLKIVARAARLSGVSYPSSCVAGDARPRSIAQRGALSSSLSCYVLQYHILRVSVPSPQTPAGCGCTSSRHTIAYVMSAVALGLRMALREARPRADAAART